MSTLGWGAAKRAEVSTAIRRLFAAAQRFISVALAVIIGSMLVGQAHVFAATTCGGSVSIHTVTPASSNDFTITVNNTGSTDIGWVDITVPSANFTYTGNSVNGWSTADHDGGTTLSGNTIVPGQTETFSVTATTDITTAPSANWAVKVTSSSNPGVNPATCGGDFSTAISGHPPNDSMNGVSNVNVSGITSSAVTISWNSDMPTTSLIYYGATSNYGSTSAYATDLVTDHAITLSGLKGGSAYHFQVAGSDGQGGYAYSADNTFVTLTPPSKSSGDSSLPLTLNSSPIIPNKALDSEPPQITVATSLAGARKGAPVVSGTATDNKAVLRVEYSTDGGRNWLPVDSISGAGQKRATFSFKPLLTQDGNYEVQARAIDLGGNITNSPIQTLVIDRLPPLVGGNIISIGPQVVRPDADGSLKTLEGIDQKITLSAVGGPTEITLEASMQVRTKTGVKAYAQHFSLAHSPDTGLWSGIVSFTRAGTYDLTVHAVDGAGNTTDRTLSKIYVAGPSHTLDAATSKPVSSTVTVYYHEPESNTWVRWDAAAFGQQNPQTTKGNGSFSVYLPSGKYYLEAKARGYHAGVSNIVTLNQSEPLSTTLSLKRMHGVHIGSYTLAWPSFGMQTIKPLDVVNAATRSSLIGKPAPDFVLTDTEGMQVHTADLFGKPTLISFESTWAPTTEEQLQMIGRLQANQDINALPIALQDSLSRVNAFTAIANSKLRWLVDPDSSLTASYPVQSLPTAYFIDRKGIVQKVVVGVLSEKEALNILAGL